jgi:putative transposase
MFNAADKIFFGVLNREGMNRRDYRTRTEARADIFYWIERCQNPRQRQRLAPASIIASPIN